MRLLQLIFDECTFFKSGDPIKKDAAIDEDAEKKN